MWTLIIFVSAALTWNTLQATNLTENANQNKTKRGLAEQTHYYGDPTVKYTQVYQDSAVSAATNPSGQLNYYSNNPRPVLFHTPVIKAGAEAEPPKQVTVQQVLYEYQQTPHNAVSNVHVNQQFQTAPEQKQYVSDPVHSQTAYSSTPINSHFVNQPHILQVEPNQFSGVAAPVQHGAIINHGQGYSKLLYGPFPVVQTTIAPVVQPKYFYTNGKILYHPAQTNIQGNPNYPVRPHNLGLQQQRPTVVTQRPFKPSPLIPITYGTHQFHPRLPVVKPTEAPVKEEVEEEVTEDKDADIREEQDEESESDDHSNYEEGEEEDDRPSYYSRYRYNEDDDDRESYREHEDEEDEDNTRSYSRQIRKKPKNKPSNRYKKNDYYKFKEGYESNKQYSTKYKSPRDYFKAEPSNKKSNSQYKSSKYSKSPKNAKPRKEVIEGHQSQNIPIIHNKKVLRQEKWVVTKKTGSD